MAERRSEDAVYYDHMGTPCRDSEYHRRCSGRWRGEINLGKDGTGKRRRAKVSAKTKTEVYEKLKDKRREIHEGIKTSGSDTVRSTVEDWLTQVMRDRATKTRQTARDLLDPLLDEIGATVLRDLTTDDVRNGQLAIAESRTTRTVRDSERSSCGQSPTPKLAGNLAAMSPASSLPGGQVPRQA
jgi:hypothetical protein